tara:strand:- start:179 stop:544 length:366 start_codon:yes stop_codon:yes gene_type:complete
MSEIKLGDKVSKRKGYAFNGVVVAVFVNTKGQTRIVAEHTGSQTEESGGMLHIFSESQLQQVSKLPIHGVSCIALDDLKKQLEIEKEDKERNKDNMFISTFQDGKIDATKKAIDILGGNCT